MRSVEKSGTELIYIYLGVTEIITAARILIGISEFIQAIYAALIDPFHKWLPI